VRPPGSSRDGPERPDLVGGIGYNSAATIGHVVSAVDLLRNI
jgi:hypothetical protein